jgi:DUF1680 family protein
VAPYRADGGLRTPHVSIGLEAAVAARPGAELYPLLRSGEPEPEAAQRCAVTLRPYFLWGNRRASAMRVWIRTE